MTQPILEAHHLVCHFDVGGSLFRRPDKVYAVDDVSLAVAPGETYAIVGESGCGKSTLARMLTRLIEPTKGEMLFDGRQIDKLTGSELRTLHRDMQFIFQDPFSSLNPRMTVGKLVAEPIETHFPAVSAKERRTRVSDLLCQVGLRPEHADRYPHEFSGGQRQRIGIARALASGPKLIVGDEPVSALDVSVQAQIINLLSDLRDALGLTLVVIAHDLAVIRHMSDRVAVMYLGRIVEEGPCDPIFEAPRHPYTMALLSAIPVAEYGRTRHQIPLIGDIPSPIDPPAGCRFHTRCPFVRNICRQEVPELRQVDTSTGQRAACHFFEEIAASTNDAQLIPEAPRPSAAEMRFSFYAEASGGEKFVPIASTSDDALTGRDDDV